MLIGLHLHLLSAYLLRRHRVVHHQRHNGGQEMEDGRGAGEGAKEQRCKIREGKARFSERNLARTGIKWKEWIDGPEHGIALAL